MTTIKFKRATASRWASVNPILAQGEPGYDTTNKKFKIGDGTSTWTQLPFQDTTYTAGTNVTITNGVISATDTKYTAGSNVSITDNVISATNTTYSAGTNITINDGVISATDTTYGEGTCIDIDNNNDISVQYDSSKGLSATGNSLGVRVDGTTIDFDSSGNLKVIGGGGGTTYTAAYPLDIDGNNEISLKIDSNTLKVNTNNELEVIGGGGGSLSPTGSTTQPIYIDANGDPQATTYELNKTVPSDAVFTDTTYTHFTGATSLADGTQGLVPAPIAGDESKFLCADGTWQTVSGGGGTSDYSDLTNKPQINSVTLSGNKTSNELDVKENFTFSAPLVQTSTTISNYKGVTIDGNNITIPYNSNRQNIGYNISAYGCRLYDINFTNGKVDYTNARFVDFSIDDGKMLAVPQANTMRTWNKNGALMFGNYNLDGSFEAKYLLGSTSGSFILIDLSNATYVDSTNYTTISNTTGSTIATLNQSTSTSDWYNTLYLKYDNGYINIRCGVVRAASSTDSTTNQAQFTSLVNTNIPVGDVTVARWFIRPFGSVASIINKSTWFKYGTYDTSVGFGNDSTVAAAVQNLPGLNFSSITNRFASIDTKAMANAPMPSEQYVNLTLGASGTTYTAPSDGWFTARLTAAAAGEMLQLIQTGGVQIWIQAAGSGAIGGTIPVRRGATVALTYTTTGSGSEQLRFIYAVGTESEYTPST